MRHFRSLREYIGALREMDEIQEIDAEVDWNLELGAIIQRSYELGAPAPLFNRIRGIEAGFRALGAPAGVSRTHGLARIALSLGWPASATGCQLVDGLNEADFIGAYLGEPLEVVDCETVDLQVPATSEIVLEGLVSVEETVCEGPIGEYTGYLNPGSGGPQPVFQVTAMTYRDQPILPVVASGEPIEENHTCWGLAISAQVLWELRSAGFPVTACFSPFHSAAHWLVVTVPTSYRGSTAAERLVGELAEILFHSRAGALIPKVILLGDDIDPANLEEVVWAFAARCHPDRGQFLFPNQEVLPLLAFLSSSEREARRSTKVIYHGLPVDDLPDEQLPRRGSFRHGVPPEIREQVLRNWRRYGYRDG